MVFVTGDIHTFIAGDVRTGERLDGTTVATELVGGSITSQSLGETTLAAGGGNTIQGNDANPDDVAGRDRRAARHQPAGRQAPTSTTTASARSPRRPRASARELVRLETIKKKSTKKLPSAAWTYKIAPGSPSIKGQHGPPAA